MGRSVLPRDTAIFVEKRCPYRSQQVEQLALYYNQQLPCPPILVIYGLPNTAKLRTTRTLFQAVQIRHAVVKSRECLTQRHLLTKIFVECVRVLGKEDEIDRYDRVDSLNALCVNLQKLLSGFAFKFVLVIDGIDKQKGASHTLLPALARLGDIIPGFSTILITSSHRPLQTHRAGIPHVHFAPYTREQAIRIVLRTPPPLQPESLPDGFPSISNVSLLSIYSSFVSAVYDTLGTHVSSTSLPIFRRSCEKLWPRFIWPLISGEPLRDRTSASDSAITWNFARLLIKNRPLFQLQAENALTTQVSLKADEPWTFDQLLEQYGNTSKKGPIDPKPSSSQRQLLAISITSTDSKQCVTAHSARSSGPFLKYIPTLLLVSSYLASHGPPKHDIILFSRLSSSSSHKRRYLSSALNKTRNPKSPRVRKTPTKAKPNTSRGSEVEADTNTLMDIDDSNLQEGQGTFNNKRQTANGVVAAEKEKTHKSSRLKFEKTSSIPRPFTLERLVAILRAIHPEGLSRNKSAADRVYCEMVDLERLRLVVRLGTSANAGGGVAGGSSAAAVAGSTGVGGGGASNTHGGGGTSLGAASGDGSGGKGTDDGILEEKWRVNVSREVVVDMGRSWGISLEGWEID